MGTARANIYFCGSNCELLTNVWRTDMVIQCCSGSYLVNLWPEILTQLKERYAKPSYVIDNNTFPLGTDQAGKILSIQVGSATAEQLTFTSSAMSLVEIYSQMKAFFTKCLVTLKDDRIHVEGIERGPGNDLTIGGDSDLVWGAVVPSSGYQIGTYYYMGAQRIRLIPPAGTYVNHVEVDIPPGCYVIWTRVCHGANEETDGQIINPKCGDEVCVKLRLPTVKTCSGYALHPVMDKLVYEQALADDAERLVAFRAIMYAAQLGKQDVLNQLDNRYQEALDKNDTELQNRVNAVISLANQLPDCM